MPFPIFTPFRPPSTGTNVEYIPKLLEADFGDGYGQPVRDGLNHIKRTLSLKWESCTPAEADSLINFFLARGGDEVFWYTISDESTPLKWRCKKFNKSSETNGFKTVTAELTQSYDLEV